MIQKNQELPLSSLMAILATLEELKGILRDQKKELQDIMRDEISKTFRHLEKIEWEESNVQDCTQGDDSVQPLVISSRGNVFQCSNQLTHENIEEKHEVSHEMVQTQTDRKVFDEMPTPIEDFCATFGDKLGISVKVNDVEIQVCTTENACKDDMDSTHLLIEQPIGNVLQFSHQLVPKEMEDKLEISTELIQIDNTQKVFDEMSQSPVDSFYAKSGIYMEENGIEVDVIPCLGETQVEIDSANNKEYEIVEAVAVNLEGVFDHVVVSLEPKVLDDVVVSLKGVLDHVNYQDDFIASCLQDKSNWFCFSCHGTKKIIVGIDICTSYGFGNVNQPWVLSANAHGVTAARVGTHGVFHFKVFDRGKWVMYTYSFSFASTNQSFTLIISTWGIFIYCY